VGVVVAAVRAGDDSGSRPVAASSSATPTGTRSPAVTPSPSAAPAEQRNGSHSDVPGAGRHQGGGDAPGRSGAGGSGSGGGAGHAKSLPFTGPPPVAATTALGLLLAVAGAWTLAGVPGPVEAPFPVANGAVDRLRAPRRATR
jgi:hypothetical protein